MRLAHPEGLTDAEAQRLASEGKALVHIDGGLHATEVAGPQHAPLLAYNLISKANEPATKAMLDNVVLMLWPTINPDGQQMVSEWYMKNVGTPYELSGLPRLYQEYVGHDNNRDAYMLNMIESRVIEHAWRQWEPQIVYVHHQTSPFPTRIWLPPFSEPVGLEAPAVIAREDEHDRHGDRQGARRERAAAARRTWAWRSTRGIRATSTTRRSSRTSPPTGPRRRSSRTPRRANTRSTTSRRTYATCAPQSLYSSPWKPGWWRLRDAVDYMETASLATIEYASKYKDSLLMNRYRAGRDQIALGATKAPYAYVVPQEQRDPVAAVELLRRLAFGGVRVSQLTDAVTIDGASYPAGTWVVPTDQEFAAMAREVLDVQRYPDLRQYPGGPPERPYDAAGWTLPLQMGVSVVARPTPLDAPTRAKMKLLGPALDVKVKPMPYNSSAARRGAVRQRARRRIRHASRPPPPSCRQRAASPERALRWSLDTAQNNSYRAINRAWKSGATVQFASGTLLVSGLSERAAGRPREVARASSPSDQRRRRRAGEEAADRSVPAVERQHGRRAGRAGSSSSTDSST